MILLSDANILIDLHLVEGLKVVSKIAPTEVLDYVLAEVEHHNQPGIMQQINAASIAVIRTEYEWLDKAAHQKEKGLTLEDKLNLYYVRRNKCILLTGEERLRKICRSENIEVHGTIWIIEQAFHRKVLRKEALCKWLSILLESNRYLPFKEIDRLRIQLGC